MAGRRSHTGLHQAAQARSSRRPGIWGSCQHGAEPYPPSFCPPASVRFPERGMLSFDVPRPSTEDERIPQPVPRPGTGSCRPLRRSRACGPETRRETALGHAPLWLNASAWHPRQREGTMPRPIPDARELGQAPNAQVFLGLGPSESNRAESIRIPSSLRDACQVHASGKVPKCQLRMQPVHFPLPGWTEA